MMFIRLVTLICLFTADIQASSHWMVTETGLIQPNENSPFEMENPFDLVSFLNQDTRWENIFILYHDLIQRQKRINKYWYQLQNAADMPKHIVSNKHCNKVDKIEVLDWYTSFVEDGKFKGIHDKEFLIHNYEKGNSNVPDCKKISSLTFSMFAFEHLEGMAQRQRLNATPEFALPELFAPIMTVDQFGHWISDTLRKNSSSWLHYNLAAIYWRVKGNAPKAIECSRRAVHYAPRRHKSVPLLCLGTVLHRSQRTSDAIIVLGAAVDHDPDFPISNFALGLAYAVSGELNTSLKHLDLSMKQHKNFDLAKKFHTAVLCHIDIRVKIDAARRAVKRLCDELDDYTRTELIWLRIQTAFLKTMKHEDKYDYLNLDYNLNKMSLLTGLKISELKMQAEKYSILQYFFDGTTYKEDWFKEKGVHSILTAQSLHSVVKHVSSSPGFPPRVVPSSRPANRSTILSEIGPIPSLPNEMLVVAKSYMTQAQQEQIKHSLQNNMEVTVGNIDTGVLQPARAPPKYPPNMKVNRNAEPFDTDPSWPPHALCAENVHQLPDSLEAIYPLFMPFENKGIKQSRLLTERIGVPALAESELPWHPPVCPPDKEASALLQKKGMKLSLVNKTLAVEYLKINLLRYVADTNLELLERMQDAEIGQRIHTAMTKRVAPEWVVCVVAGLYWRGRRLHAHAAPCLVRAARLAPAADRDVALLSLASLLLDMGLVQDAAKHAEDAYKINSYEPTTNFILAQLSMVKKNPQALMFHLKQTIRVEPNFLNGIARRLLTVWACIFKQKDAAKHFEERKYCTEMEPGLTMVCERDGTGCQLTNRNCNAVHTQAESESALLRILELKDHSGIDSADESVFDKFVREMPRDRRDKLGHQRHFDNMVKVIDSHMKGCGFRGCHELTAEYLELTEEECEYQHLQLDYWLHLITFKQVLQDSNTKLPPEMVSYSVSVPREPLCVADPAGEWLVARVLAVDPAGWQPLLAAMHHFAEMFHYYEYTALGAKIAKYIEAKPASWVGLVSAMWWCGVSGRGACAVRCAAAAIARLGLSSAHVALRPLAALLYMQSRTLDAKNIAYLSFYTSPKNKLDAFLVAVSHTYRAEYEQAIWMFRYALAFDEDFLPAKACLHITMCLMLFKDPKKKVNEIPA